MTTHEVPANPGAAEHAALRADLALVLPLADGLAAILGGPTGLPPAETGRAAHAALVADLAENLDLSSGLKDILSAEAGHHALLADLPDRIDLASGLARILGPASPVPTGSRDAGFDATDATESAIWPTATLAADTENNLAKLAAAPDADRLLLRLNNRYRHVRAAIDLVNDIRHALAQPAGSVQTDTPTDSTHTTLLRHHEALTRLIADLVAASPDVPDNFSVGPDNFSGTVGVVNIAGGQFHGVVSFNRGDTGDLEQHEESTDPEVTDSDDSEKVWRPFQGFNQSPGLIPTPMRDRLDLLREKLDSFERELDESSGRRFLVKQQLDEVRARLLGLEVSGVRDAGKQPTPAAERLLALSRLEQQLQELTEQLGSLEARDARAEAAREKVINEYENVRQRLHANEGDRLLSQSDNVLRDLVDDLVELHDSGLIDQVGAAHRQACREGAAQLALVLDQVVDALTSFHGADLRDAEIRPEDSEDLDGIRWCDQTADGAATRWPTDWESTIRRHSVEVPWSPGSFVIRWGAPIRSTGG